MGIGEGDEGRVKLNGSFASKSFKTSMPRDAKVRFRGSLTENIAVRRHPKLTTGQIKIHAGCFDRFISPHDALANYRRTT
jgi:hypothetical protein